MPANLENSTVPTGLENVSFHSNPKERQCQRMLKLRHNCTHLTCNQSNTQNSPSQFQQYMNRELSDIQAGLRKGRGAPQGPRLSLSGGGGAHYPRRAAGLVAAAATETHPRRVPVGLPTPLLKKKKRKCRGTRDQVASICWIIETAREFQKKHLLLLH